MERQLLVSPPIKTGLVMFDGGEPPNPRVKRWVRIPELRYHKILPYRMRGFYDPAGIRTQDTLLKRQALYQAELPGHGLAC